MKSEAGDARSKLKAVAAIGVLVAIGIAGYVGGNMPAHDTSFDPGTATCDNDVLMRKAHDLIEGNTSPLIGKLSILKIANGRPNPSYQKSAQNVSDYAGMSQTGIMADMLADRKSQCAADIITSRGEMTLYYGWKTIDNEVYVEAKAIPKLD